MEQSTEQLIEQLKEQLVSSFIQMQPYLPKFKRKEYEGAFKKCYGEQSELLAKIVKLCEGADSAKEKEQIMDALASAIPEHVHAIVSREPKKQKRERLMMDYNMVMVTFVVPLFTYNGSECCDVIADMMVEKWNDGPITMKIQKSTFEMLNGSFKSHPCYITTAVCESQHKPDDCYELTLLREYRDKYLLGTASGEEVVACYYDIAPTIVNRINKEKDASKLYQEIYDTYLSSCIRLIEEDRREECRDVYTRMVKDLQKKYLYS